MKLVTCNTLNGVNLVSGHVDNQAMATEMAALSADVVALQEVDRGQTRSGGVDQTEFTGIILAGGQSRRMGVDKALLQVDGVALSVLVARALRAAGACEVFAIGGDAPMLSAMGLRVIADEWPGQGPLGGLITGLRAASCEIAVAMACDQPRVDPPLVHRLVDLLAADDTFDAVVPVHDGRDQVLHAAYRSRAQIELGFAFDRGVRAPSLALAGLRVHRVSIDEAEALADLDTPEEFARYRQYRDSLPE